jgi:hypothetical protein
MADCQITCATKPHRESPHEHITHVGNPARGWVWPREAVVASIDAGTNTFFVTDPNTGRRVNVAVVAPQGRAKYLRTHADGVWTDNLLSLNTCPMQ